MLRQVTSLALMMERQKPISGKCSRVVSCADGMWKLADEIKWYAFMVASLRPQHMRMPACTRMCVASVHAHVCCECACARMCVASVLRTG